MAILGIHGSGELFLFITSFFIGISVTVGVNAVYSAPSFMMSYYKYIYGDPNATSHYTQYWENVMTFYSVNTLATQALLEPLNLTQFLCRFSIMFRLLSSAVLMFCEMILLLIMPHVHISEKTAVIGVMVAAFLGGFGRAYFENTCYALVAPCPSKHLSAVLSGAAMAGVVTSALQLLLLGVMSSDYHSLLTQSVIYFTFSIGIIFTSCVLLVSLYYNSFAKKYIPELQSERSAWRTIYENSTISSSSMPQKRSSMHTSNPAISLVPQSNRSDVGVEDDDAKIEVDEAHNPETGKLLTAAEALLVVKVWSLLKRIYPMMLACFTTYFVTLTIFPGVFVAIDRNSFWYPTVVTAVYNVGDFTGRTMTVTRRLWLPRKVILISTFARIAVVPLVVMCAMHRINSQPLVYIVSIFFGISNGYLSTMSMVYTPDTASLNNDAERALASQATGVCLLAGCAMGSFLQLAVVLEF